MVQSATFKLSMKMVKHGRSVCKVAMLKHQTTQKSLLVKWTDLPQNDTTVKKVNVHVFPV